MDHPQYYLHRKTSTLTETMGEWVDDKDEHVCFTIELPWLDNEPGKSCIPAGDYIFNAYDSPEHGPVWMAQDVPGRSCIEIHNANFAYQLLGCIGVGDSIGHIGGVMAVLHSIKTLDMLRRELPTSFRLTITQ